MSGEINSSLGTTIAIGTTVSATNQSEYEADSYTLIGEVENIGEVADVFAEIGFSALANGRNRKYKGQRDGGTVPLVIGLKNGDAGQTAIKTALNNTSRNDFNFKITLTDGDPDVSPVIEDTVVYFSGKVMSRSFQGFDSGSVNKIAVSIAINSDLVEVEAA